MTINWWLVARIVCYVFLLIVSIGENPFITAIAVLGLVLDIAGYLWERHQRNQHDQSQQQ
ncbi:hypothetical protein CSQ86_04635 [Bifidobacterium felsineum]|uniref:Uncharacterized protein n=1 Tax=Bifidobacterium felsineum TaxID=2045440 RepID=A0A2M9HK50_9BIFI|nr:hypothetical protein CSQ86_04635 [Bifidobacterium felsineum]